MHIDVDDIRSIRSKVFRHRIINLFPGNGKHQNKYQGNRELKDNQCFTQTDPSKQFYILLKGHIKLILGETGQVVYIVSHAGESFGWSSLIERETYTASAECMSPTKLLIFDQKKVLRILEEDPANGLVFFKRLADILGNRLLHSYKMISSAAQIDVSPSFGTGQVVATTVSDAEL